MKINRIILEGRKINIKWAESEQIGANAYPLSNKIVLSENADKILSKEEFNSILLHERGHFELILKYFLPFYPLIISFGILILIILNPQNEHLAVIRNNILVFISLVIVSMLFLKWLAEIFADNYSIIRTRKGAFQRGLKKVNNHNLRFMSYFEKILRVYVIYPPPCLRYYFINRFDNNKIIRVP
jgi:Zn-dependent protease with chaperone function